MKKRREALFYKGFRRFVGYCNLGHRSSIAYIGFLLIGRNSFDFKSFYKSFLRFFRDDTIFLPLVI